MTTVYGSFDPPLGQSEARGVIVFTPKVEIDTPEGMVPRVSRGVRLMGGEFSTSVVPGPYWIEARIVGSKDWAKKRSVVVPDQESIEIDELFEAVTNWDPMVVGAAQQARDAAIAAKTDAEQIVENFEAGIVPDEGVASKITDAASATRAALDARVLEVGNAQYAGKSVETDVAAKYTKPADGIPLADIKKADLDAEYAPMWKANTDYTANAPVILPNGKPAIRTANGTSRATFDTTEEAAWTVTGGATTVDGLTDATTVGKAVVKATDAAAARTAIGALDTPTTTWKVNALTGLVHVPAGVTGAQFQAALDWCVANSGAGVYVPPGTINLAASVNVSELDGIEIRGAGRDLTKFVVGSAVTTAAFLATAGAAVADLTLRDFSIDCTWTTGRNVLAGIQITNGVRPIVERVAVRNSGGAGILMQGLNAGGGTTSPTVRNCVIDKTGLSDGTTGHGIWIKDNSDDAVIEGNLVLDVKGGMGIGLSGASDTGYPERARITGNRVRMASSTTGFEPIGLTTGCSYAIVSGNTVWDSFDNGISVTADFCTVTGNNVNGTYNHGITAGGNGTQVVGNFVRNVGKEDPALGFGGITLDTGASNCIVMGNRIVDDQATKTMGYGIKLNESGGNNRIGPNRINGWLTSAYFGLLSTDLVIDTESYDNGFAMTRIYTDAIAAKTTNGTLTCSAAFNLNNFGIIGAGASKTAQLTVFTNAGSTRANAALPVATGQVAPVLKVLNPSDATIAEITKDGVFKAASFATGARPDAATAGAGGMIFDTTLGKPIWSDGTNWKDATGATV